MRALSVIFFLFALLLGVGAVIYVQKPSVMPLATVIGAFSLPALFAWWGKLLWSRANSRSAQGRVDEPSAAAPDLKTSTVLKRRAIFVAAPVALLIAGVVAFWQRNSEQQTKTNLVTNPVGRSTQATSASGPSIEVNASCPQDVRLLTFSQLRARHPQYTGYDDSELAQALVQVCYPAESPSHIRQRLEAFNTPQGARQ